MTATAEIITGNDGPINPTYAFLGGYEESKITQKNYHHELSQLAILAGYYVTEADAKGEVRLVGMPHEVPWHQMKPHRFRELFLARRAQPVYKNGKEVPRAESSRLLTASTIRQLAEAMKREKLIDRDRCDEIKDLPKKRFKRLPPERSLSRADLEALVGHFRGDTSTRGIRDASIIIACGLGGGLRVSEISSLDLASYNPDTGVVRVMGKGSKEDDIALDANVCTWLDRWISVRGTEAGSLFQQLNRGGSIARARARLSARSIARICEERAEEIGIERFTPHSMRRGTANLMRLAGADIGQIQTHLRHSSIATTGAYFRFNRDEMVSAVAKMGIPPALAA